MVSDGHPVSGPSLRNQSAKSWNSVSLSGVIPNVPPEESACEPSSLLMMSMSSSRCSTRWSMGAGIETLEEEFR